MSLAKLIPITLHGVADYAVGLVLVIAPFVLGFQNQAALWISVVVGAAVIVVSALTNYPYSLLKWIPIGLHSLADYAVGILLIAAPLSLYAAELAALWPHVVLGAAVIAVSLLTAYRAAYDTRLA